MDIFLGKWEKKLLTYRILQYSSKLSKADVDREIQKAFNIWQQNSGLVFKSIANGPADIEIRFSYHGTIIERFDGPGKTLAYAYFPVSFLPIKLKKDLQNLYFSKMVIYTLMNQKSGL